MAKHSTATLATQPHCKQNRPSAQKETADVKPGSEAMTKSSRDAQTRPPPRGPRPTPRPSEKFQRELSALRRSGVGRLGPRSTGAAQLGASSRRTFTGTGPALRSGMASRCGVNVVPKDLLMDPRQHVREGFLAVPEHECQSSCRPRHVLALVMRNNLQGQGL